MSLADTLAEDRRLVVLRTLTEVDGYHLNEMVLKSALDGFGHRASRDLLRGDLDWLEMHRLIRIERIDAPTSGELWLVHLKLEGKEVAQGRAFPGIARLDPI